MASGYAYYSKAMRTPFAVFVLAAAMLPAQPQEQEANKAWAKEMGRGDGSLQPGDLAPDFKLRKAKSKESVRLSKFRGKKPVALVFGSYT